MSTTFNTLGLTSKLIEGLKKENIVNPTEIQIETIPKALENKNVIGQSETGSGKTLAYLLPIFQKIDTSKREMQTIILAPTHELVMQIEKEIKLLSNNSEIHVTSTTIIGEVNMKRQIENLKQKPHIIVGSAGRILELIKKRKISAHTIKTIVVDEGDRLLDKSNISRVKDIIKCVMRDTQKMVFSATINEKTLDIAKGLMQDPEIIKVQNKLTVNKNITHMFFTCEQRDKIEVLRKLLASINPQKAIVFLNKPIEIDITTSKLKFHNISVCCISGKSSKEDRKKSLDNFKNGKTKILIASDVAARGLDIKDVTHIFNLDLPNDPMDYLHRVGRTGRYNNTGTALSIVTETELSIIKKYEKAFNIEIPKKKIFKGKIS